MSSPEPRLEPLPVEQWGDEVLAALRTGRGSLLSPELNEALDHEDLPRLFEILPTPITTMLAHPALTGRFLAYTGVFLSESTIPARWRELVVLRVAWRCRCRYVWLQHVRMSPRFEITRAEIEAVAEGADAGSWAPAEGVLLAATDQLLDRYSLDEPTWSRLAAFLDERQLLELPLLVGAYLSQAFAYNSIGIVPGPVLESVGAPVLPPSPEEAGRPPSPAPAPDALAPAPGPSPSPAPAPNAPVAGSVD